MKGFTKGKGKGKKFIPTSKKQGLSQSDLKKRHAEEDKQGLTNAGLGSHATNLKMQKFVKEKRNKKSLDVENLSSRELRDHHSFEESNAWLDVLSENPEVIVFDEGRQMYQIWFGGESHYVHYYTLDGHETDVYSWGFEQNKLKEEDVLQHIAEDIEEGDEDEDRNKESLDKPNSFNAQKKSVIDNIEDSGFKVAEESSHIPEDERDDPDEDTFHSLRFEISEEKMLSVMDGTKTAGEMIDELTNTTTDERLRFSIDSGNPLHKLMQEGKAHVDSSSGKPVWKKGKA